MKTVLLTVNAAWNVVNFRMGVVRALLKSGFRVVVAAPADGYESRLIAAGCEFVNLPMSRKGVNPIEDGLLLLRYILLYKKIQPDVVLGYTIKPNIYGGLAAALMGVKIINNIAGLGTAFMGRGALRFLAVQLYRLGLKSSACVFFQNPDDFSLFKSLRIVERQTVEVLPGSGVDAVFFSPQISKKVDSFFKFLFVGRLLKDKGLGELVDAVRLLRAQGIDSFVVDLVGAVDSGNPSAIDWGELQTWQDQKLVRYHGVTDDVRGFIADSDCVILPSYREGAPRVILEAAAMERISIVTDVPGCRDVVVHGETGFKVLVKDHVSLADAMRSVVSLSQDVRVDMGRAARAFVLNNFSESIVVDRYLYVICRLV